ncbi:MAG TPA: DUF2267 domain-containing protein [Myxococcales bacterium]|jgi:uncharacterized protein (DUF2267 family)|nr:DUF2267 domain-containing protein [Myxococcales bacterium]
MSEGRRPFTGEELGLRRFQRRESRASQTYAAFLKDLCRIGSMKPEFAERAAVSVLCTLEQRLIPEEARDLEAQLPIKLLNLLNRCDRHSDQAPVKYGRQELLEMVAEDLNMQPDEVEPIIRAVFRTVREHVSEGEIEDVIHMLPNELRDLWQRPM